MYSLDLFADESSETLESVLGTANFVYVFIGHEGNRRLAPMFSKSLQPGATLASLEYPMPLGSDGLVDPWQIEGVEPVLDLTLYIYKQNTNK